jgi:hypothetical protein
MQRKLHKICVRTAVESLYCFNTETFRLLMLKYKTIVLGSRFYLQPKPVVSFNAFTSDQCLGKLRKFNYLHFWNRFSTFFKPILLSSDNFNNLIWLWMRMKYSMIFFNLLIIKQQYTSHGNKKDWQRLKQCGVCDPEDIHIISWTSRIHHNIGGNLRGRKFDVGDGGAYILLICQQYQCKISISVFDWHSHSPQT